MTLRLRRAWPRMAWMWLGHNRGRTHVKIEIYGQSYNVAAEGNEDHIRELGEYVDVKMRTASQAAQTVDSVKVAVLAALNIADEMFRLRDRQQQLEGPLRKRVERCVHMVERALERSN